MNIPKFVVLGTLDRLGPASGYDIIRELENKMISRWTNVKKGSIYHALKALNKEALVEETERLKQGPRVGGSCGPTWASGPRGDRIRIDS